MNTAYSPLTPDRIAIDGSLYTSQSVKVAHPLDLCLCDSLSAQLGTDNAVGRFRTIRAAGVDK